MRTSRFHGSKQILEIVSRPLAVLSIAVAVEPDAKRPRVGTMPADLKKKIAEAVDAIGEVEAYKKPHRKGPGPVQARVLPPEALVHEKTDEIRRGQANRRKRLACAARLRNYSFVTWEVM